MLLLIVGIMVVVDLFVLFSDIMQLGELMIRNLLVIPLRCSYYVTCPPL